MRTILIESTGRIGLRISTRRTSLLELTGPNGLFELTIRTSKGRIDLIELTGHTSLLKPTRLMFIV